MKRTLRFLRDHGITCRPTEDGKIIAWDIWTYRTDLGELSGAAEWYEMEPTIKAAKDFLNY